MDRKRLFVIGLVGAMAMLLGVVLFCPSQAQVQEWNVPELTVATQPTTPTAEAKLLPGSKPNRLFGNRRERRALGITPRNVRKALVELQKEGCITKDVEPSIAAVMVAEKLINENPSAYQAAAQEVGDWDTFLEALIAFLEKLIPLILMFI